MRRSRRGISLIETMISIAVLLVMSVLSWQAIKGAVEFQEVLSMKDGTTRSARMALGRLTRELQLAYLTPNRTGPVVEHYRTVFVAEDNDPDTLFFATLAHKRVYMNSRESDQAEITVWAESSPSEKGDGYILYHRESARIDEEPDEGGVVYPLAYNVRSFNLRFLHPDREEWVDEWNTNTAEFGYQVPRVIEIGLVLLSPDPNDPDRNIEVPFLTRVKPGFGVRLDTKRVLNNGRMEGAAPGAQGGVGGARPGGRNNRPGSGPRGLPPGVPNLPGISPR